jgi:hypothetical protein
MLFLSGSLISLLSLPLPEVTNDLPVRKLNLMSQGHIKTSQNVISREKSKVTPNPGGMGCSQKEIEVNMGKEVCCDLFTNSRIPQGADSPPPLILHVGAAKQLGICIEGLLWYIRKFFLHPWRRDWRILATAAAVAEPILDSLPLTLHSGIKISNPFVDEI